ncbi:MAG: hypothetical protein M1833_001263 [Piccolia ochrophora]|nr:MAG: hypothetical protein M1833_001263 [Piccolia ochrophora]
MLKRFPLQSRSRNPVIGEPVLVQTTFDQLSWENLPHVSEIRYGQQTPTTTPDSAEQNNEYLRGLPRLPFESFEPRTNTARPVSDIPTASSVYSQPSPDHRQMYNNSIAPSPLPVYQEVSPPSSPDMENSRSSAWHGSRSVSPVEEPTVSPDPQRDAQYISSIPVLRRAKRRGEDVKNTRSSNNGTGNPGTGLGLKIEDPNRASTMTRWDTFSGEPTTSEDGKPGLIHTSKAVDEFSKKEATASVETPDTGQRQSTAKSSFAERALKSGLQGLRLKDSKPKEEWRGASGRQTIVSPMSDKPLPPTEIIMPPRRSSRRMHSGENSGQSTPVTGLRRPAFGPLTSSPVGETHDDEIKPTVPLKAGRNTPPKNLTSPTSSRHPSLVPEDPKSPPPVPAPSSSPVWGLDDAQGASVNTQDSNAINESHSKSIEDHFRRAMNDIHDSQEPASRFSFTTYATGTTHDTPPQSPAPSLPSAADSPRPSSVLNRSRPVASTTGSSNAKAVSRKPAPLHTATNAPTSAPLGSKSLPQSPPEMQSVDLITSLEAQASNLRHRRNNIQRIMRDLEKIALSTSITYSTQTRNDARARLQRYSDELAEIVKEDHDVGLRLHRAWRRRDYKENREPSGLWVRRVTG